MKTFEFKFDIGQRVFIIGRSQKQQYKKCEHCNGTGWLKTLVDEKILCPKCHFGSNIKYDPIQYNVEDGFFTIGQQRVYISKSKTEEQYMCDESGIGSGTIYYVKNIFKTKKEAQEECNKRNKK